jgi:hypothetical protein
MTPPTEQLKALRTRMDAITVEIGNIRATGGGDNFLLMGMAVARANYWLACEIQEDKKTARATITAAERSLI